MGKIQMEFVLPWQGILFLHWKCALLIFDTVIVHQSLSIYRRPARFPLKYPMMLAEKNFDEQNSGPSSIRSACVCEHSSQQAAML